ncbi:MAG: DNA replication and repair protein RecF [Bacillota bacterium]|nr:MAG: DNA replication and repair protein RecF [Bacillota bacterium]MBS3951287.1 DNA replication/repair protein RecF [Peptococcaceae bacterium]
MWVEELTLKDYRNYKNQRVSFSRSLNFVVGANGEGKTNMLEALYLLATTKSHRMVSEKELVRTNSDFFYLSCRLHDARVNTTVELGYSLSQKRKAAKISSVPVTRISELIGVLNVVLFAPEDLDLVKGSPSGRRRFLDVLLSQVDKVYFGLLQQYSRVLAQRNECLKAIQLGRLKTLDLEPWTEQFIDLALKISGRRHRAVSVLREEFARLATQINQGKESLLVEYIPSLVLEGTNQATHEQLSRLLTQEIKRGITLCGPHRDDLRFSINSLPATDYASQGQQRTAALALKLAELAYMRYIRGEYPVLLLDDVLSELDANRRAALIEVLSRDVQAIITGTELVDLSPIHVKGNYQVIRIEQGKVM